MPELPPIDRVPLFSLCPECARPFRGVTSWKPGSPATRAMRCPWCGANVRLYRRHVGRVVD